MSFGADEKKAIFQVLTAILVVAVSFWLGAIGAEAKLNVLTSIAVFFLAMAVSFVRGTDGLYLVIFAMIFSPEIVSGIAARDAAGEGAGGVVIRLDDIIMMAVFMGWMLRSAYTGRHHGIVRTKVNGAIWVYMGASIVATLFGVIRGSVGSFVAGMLHNVKYFEYFLLFFMVLAHVRRKVIVVRMIWTVLFVFFLACLYGYWQLPSGQRLCAPFDAEPNTFGGYLVLMMCLATGIALTDTRFNVRVIALFLALFGCIPLFFTLSRSSYMAMIAGFISFLVMSKRRIIIASVVIAVAALTILGVPVIPGTVQQRVTETFEKGTQYHVKIGSQDLDPSTSARIISYQEAFKIWLESPIVGKGVTGAHFIDGQFPRVLAEAGLLGLSTLLLVLWYLLLAIKKVYNEAEDKFLKGAAMGLFCGTIAMIIHSSGANTFIILRIAEPLWLLSGLILLVPVLENKKDLDREECADKQFCEI